GYIYNYFDEKVSLTVSNCTVKYTPSTAQYLKIEIESDAEKPIILKSVELLTHKSTPPEKEDHAFDATIQKDEKTNSTILTLDTGSEKGVYSEGIIFNSTSANFNRLVEVSMSNDNKSWMPITYGYIFNLNLPRFKGINMQISYPEIRYRYIKAQIYHENNEPIDISPQISLKISTKTLVFNYDPTNMYTLYYGNDIALATSYDLSRFIQYIDDPNLPKGFLTDNKSNQMYVAPTPIPKPITEQYSQLLNIILIVLVVGFAVFIVWYMKKLQK
ncbi:MAG: hypothetical protein WCO06_04010, partial [Candidatus Roizmanbacteria bacterium]